jgi:hypothetical protein
MSALRRRPEYSDLAAQQIVVSGGSAFAVSGPLARSTARLRSNSGGADGRLTMQRKVGPRSNARTPTASRRGPARGGRAGGGLAPPPGCPGAGRRANRGSPSRRGRPAPGRATPRSGPRRWLPLARAPARSMPGSAPGAPAATGQASSRSARSTACASRTRDVSPSLWKMLRRCDGLGAEEEVGLQGHVVAANEGWGGRSSGRMAAGS